MAYLPPQVNCSLLQDWVHHKDAVVSLLNYLNCYLGNLAYLSSLGTTLLTATVNNTKRKVTNNHINSYNWVPYTCIK